MRKLFSISILLLLISSILFAQEGQTDYENNWPQWRGPLASGVAPSGNPPIEWNENNNVRWKAEIPGIGHATPIIWGDQMILLSAVKTDQEITPDEQEEEQQQNSWMAPISTNFIHQFAVLSVDRKDGRIMWQTTVREELPYSHTHKFGSWASNSPVTDGERIYAYFGSHGLYCLNMNGDVLWERDLGRMDKHMSFGEGSSPVLYEDKLIILQDHKGQSLLYVLDKMTGKDILKVKRDEQTSWSTPYVVEFGEKTQVITSATNRIRSHDLNTGDVIWECTGMTRNVIPVPVMDNNIVYLMSGYRESALIAVDLTKASGDISNTDAIVWQSNLNTSYTPSPVIMDGKIYFLKVNKGYLTCLDAKDGREYYSNSWKKH